ncbi:hypothetical protein KVE48_05220 [Helicobacter pylori]|nr:hypothetical protein KVE48_05220 [Helicobacter pylori]
MELKLCKIPTIGTQSENQTLPTGNISLGSPIVFSGWALHQNASLKENHVHFTQKYPNKNPNCTR